MSSSSLSTGSEDAPVPSVGMDDLLFEAYSYVEDIPNFEDYLWYLDKQAYSDKFYCKIDNIILTNVWSNDLKYFYKIDDNDQTKFLLLMGKLIPCQQSSPPVLIKIAVPVNCWFFYFNEISSMSSGKVWVKDHEGTWFQVLNPHRELYQTYSDRMQASITNTIESIPVVDEKKTIEISNAFICNRNWNWVELDPFLSFSLQGVFIHGDIILRENGEIGNRRMSIRIPITDFIFEYFHCLSNCSSKLHSDNDTSEKFVNVHWYSTTYKVWLTITSVDSKYKSTYNSFLRRASIEHLLNSHGQKLAMFSRPVLPIFIDTLVDKNSQIHFKKQSLGITEFKTNPAIALIRIQDKMGSLQGYFPILDWMVEIGKGKAGLRSFFETEENIFLRIGHSKDTEASSCFMPDELFRLINKYNSPLSEDGQIWRHVADFCCFYVDEKEKESHSRHTSNSSSNNNHQQSIKSHDSATLDKSSIFGEKFSGHFISALYFSDEKKQKPLLKGKLVPLATSSSKKKDTISFPLLPLSVIIHINVYSIDFGASMDDENRGLWMTGVTTDTWYKLIAPAHPAYQSIAVEDFSLTKDLLAFVDLIQDDNAKIGVLEDRHTGKIIIPYSVKEMFHRVKKGKLNLYFWQHNPEFAVSNLNVIVNWDKSKEFYQSIYDLKEEDYSKWNWREAPVPLCNHSDVTNDSSKRNNHSNHYNSNSIQDNNEKPEIPKKEIIADLSMMDVDNRHINENAFANAEKPSPVSSSTSAGKKTIHTGTKRSFLNIDTNDSAADDDASALTSITTTAKTVLTADTAPSQLPTEQPQQPPQKKIKRKERSIDDEDDKFDNLFPASQSTNNSNNSNAFLCPYCRKLQKLEKCMNIHHEDGKMLHPKGKSFFLSHPSPVSTSSDTATNSGNNSRLKTNNGSPRSPGIDDESNVLKLDLCPYCKSLTKMPKCPLSIHPDGEQLKRRIPHLGEDDEGHERRQYEKQHRMLHFSAWNATQHPANMMKATCVAVSSNNPAISAAYGGNSWGKTTSREDYQGRIVEVADNAATVHKPENASSVAITSIRSILKKTSFVPQSENNSNNTAYDNNSNSDENPTDIVPETAKSTDNLRKQFLQSLQQQRIFLRQPLSFSSKQKISNTLNNQNAESRATTTTSTLLWQDEHPDHNKTLGYAHIIEKVDLSQIPRYLPTPFTHEELDEVNQNIQTST